ncbi:MAG: TauD/TfdA family dioxygenase, partial [Rhodospirillales bacterium]|nr:TauD/TfdA family dioxygenase [Rhodospirillales bacterium]
MQTDASLLQSRPLAPSFGAELSGMPIHGDVSDDDLRAFVDALHRHRVLLLRVPGLDPADLVAFSKRMGPLELHAAVEAQHPAHPEIFCVGNVVRDGITANFARGIEQWHADSSYRETPSDASLFYGEVVPPEGAETMFADATGAWDALDPAMQRRIEGLRAMHSLATLYDWNRRHTPERPPLSEAKRALWPPVSQPLVRTHPVTGVKSLYLCPAVIS